MRKRAKKKKTKMEMYASVPIGTGHFLRGGSGAHQDKKKQENKTKCREVIECL
jgi:hypothetical protein